jgi:predicted lipoprotein with Yx(FWY)xxD motif
MNSHLLVSKFKFSARWVSLLVPLALILAACQPAAVSSPTPAVTSAPAATVAPTAASIPDTSGTEPSLNVATDPTLGQILVDGNGMTLYMFTKDGPNQSNCTGNCLDAWPPLLTQGSPTLGPGVDASLVGTATLADGTMMVTYNQMPLYTWSKDKKPGDTTGQGNKNVWYVVAPDGKPVGYEPPASSAPAATSAPAASAPEATINVATDSTLGQILVDGNGMTLYIFTKDGPNQSNCTGSCMDAWPPLLTQGSPTLGPGVDDSLVGTATLADGTQMVTYNQMPLYAWSKDKKPGDTTGQGFKNVWYVVSPGGEAVGR